MHVSITAKRCAAGAIAALALTAAAPALASAAVNPQVPGPVLIDFAAHSPNGDEAGQEFGGLGSVIDQDTHDVIGGVAVDCADVQGDIGQVYTCSGEFVLLDHDKVKGHVTFQATTLRYTGGNSQPDFDGVITGGTGVYEGLTGSIHFVRDSNKVYEASFESAS